ncbi:threonine/homoserine/homoserine lactone efflux protein [Kitasatospora sp. MAA4]|uniref:LysE family translocator n=1 Tax=Kitasatospora sp. MAA4 TaxID=3035093 RepID=UPI0024747152|nr:LysE family translocator [Kitasatospora sp. MAA4]MDH6131361.1 threonine/homoserine/homoserine lactone efflux protein [Kitasatospora sp. MAA4]
MKHPCAVCTVAGFLAAVFPLVATPGTSLTLLLQQVADGGRRRALPVILGTVTGLYVHASLAMAGLAALVMRSSQAFEVVKLVGVAYLVGLAAWTWRSATRSAAPARAFGGAPYVQALLGNVLNPKAASIYLTLVPQFVTPDQPVAGQILTLATAHALVIALWLALWTALVGLAGRTLRTPGFRSALARITAIVLLALGIRAAVG